MAARARMRTARRRRPAGYEPQPGIAAQYADICARCDDAIVRGSRIVFSHGRPIHVTCASGQDDI